jgi:hypothetical protein
LTSRLDVRDVPWVPTASYEIRTKRRDRALRDGGSGPIGRRTWAFDGQQRLTSLYQAIYGVGSSRFFLDIGALMSGAGVNDAVRVFSADRSAALEALKAQARALMMPVSAALDSEAGRWRDEIVDLRDDDDPSRVRGLLRDVDPGQSRAGRTDSGEPRELFGVRRPHPATVDDSRPALRATAQPASEAVSMPAQMIGSRGRGGFQQQG